ncbi:Bile acid 7-dehydroxylase 1/3 [Serratia rubidaea]|uniref:Bile acid 7-dehydroxylase 1/3 n=1 Tax=Serratia rubidaea TaxID=61652 RepID=A0A4U9HQL8_SERRU|nr:Bile acid 7-dehydroxylase 1/3 [Serratia rubidaea]
MAFCGRSQDKLDGALAQLQAEFPQAQILAQCCDVLDPEQVTQFAGQVEARFGGVDMLINNAGQGYVAHFEQTPRTAWLHEAELKLFGVINPLQAFLPALERSDIASITCVNSLLALQPEEHMDRHLGGARCAAQYDADAVERTGGQGHPRELHPVGDGGVGPVATPLCRAQPTASKAGNPGRRRLPSGAASR